MDVTLWGVQGSISGTTQERRFYGGNTPCVELRTQDNDLLIFDAGSGLCLLGRTLPPEGECRIFLTHAHLDHIQGLGFFPPLTNPSWITHLYLPEWLIDLPQTFFNGTTFPLDFDQLRGNIRLHALQVGETVTFPGSARLSVTTFAANHPGRALAYQVHADNTVFAYSGDHEITPDAAVQATTRAMLHGAHLAVVDATYSRADYRPGWGHSAWQDWVSPAEDAGVECLVLFHHSPERTDAELDALQSTLVARARKRPCLYAAVEGMRFAPPASPPSSPQRSEWLYEFTEELSRYKDESILLDRILAKAREMTKADAGTVFLAENDELVFAYTHNDTLFPVDAAYKYAYADVRLPISTQSIVGYAASTHSIVNIPDAYTLPPDVPYRFNHSFDDTTGYRTHSLLTVPFFDRNGTLLGVIQLINSLDLRRQAPKPFTAEDGKTVRLLAREAARILETSSLVRTSIYRLLRAASIHDPMETGPHAERVGAMAAEIYQRWAEKHQVETDHARFVKSDLRLAAMLHDIGKVGISDLILKKPGKLTDEEFLLMRKHTTLGADLLAGDDKDVSGLAREISLHHHQKWNGCGYAGVEDDTRLAGEDIPLGARITAIADVFDALVSPRCYKEPWTFEAACDLVRREAGSHFDPLLVDCFLEILDTVRLVYARFPDAQFYPNGPKTTG